MTPTVRRYSSCMTGSPRDILTRPAPPPDRTVSYGSDREQIVDIRVPAQGQSRPLVVLIHGGFWRSQYDRRHTAPLAVALAERGHAVATIEYRRIGQRGGGWTGTFDDVAAAVAAIRELAARADVTDVHRPLLVGHSAGGHLALWYASRATAVLRGVLALAPVADLTTAYRQRLGRGAVAELLGGSPGEVPARYAIADPVALVRAEAPTVLVHGLSDLQVPVGQSRVYAAAAHDAGGDVRLVELPDVDHFSLIDPLSSAWQVVARELDSLCR